MKKETLLKVKRDEAGETQLIINCTGSELYGITKDLISALAKEADVGDNVVVLTFLVDSAVSDD